MTKPFSDIMLSEIRKALHEAEASGEVFDVYSSATKIRERFPDEVTTTDELVNLMLQGLGSIPAIELSPPSLLIEIILPAETSDESRESAFAE
jgi:hypothetical protein